VENLGRFSKREVRPKVAFFTEEKPFNAKVAKQGAKVAKKPRASSVRSPITMTGVPFAIRDFRPEDFETLWRMDQECFPPGISYSREELKVYMRRRGSFTLVAGAEDGAIAGFLVAYGGLTGHVITIDVSPAARRSGVGSLLLRAAEDRLREGGSRAVGLETAVDNLSALSFYKRHGYSVVRTWPRYYSNGVDALVLKKELSEIKTG
jgi:ribosomal-protein-alanine N-acetyltransferase